MTQRKVILDSMEYSLHSIIDSTYNGILAVDQNGYVTVCNAAAAKRLGITQEEALGCYIEDLIPDTKLPRVLKTGQSDMGKKLRFGGSILLANRTPILKEGKIIGAVAVFQDITDLQKIIDELTNVKELKTTLETVLNHAYDGIVVVNDKAVVTMANEAFADFLEMDPKEIVGRPISEVIGDTNLDRVLQSGTAEIGELQRLKGHEVVVMRIPIIKDGQIVGAVGKIMFKNIQELNALARRVNSLRTEVDYYRGELQRVIGGKYNFDNIIGQCRQIFQLKETARKVAKSNSTVLIRGESGTGKELIAHALHNESDRRYGPFIKVNCAAMPENLLESELFGYKEGAFTGAKKGGQVGKFELADKGTIFLDEVGDMSLNMQAKLLRVLQEKEVERLGDSSPKTIDVRVIAATNRNLEELISKEKFREDIYYRLNVISLHVPPLRERKADLPLLMEYFMEKFNREFGLSVRAFEPEVARLCESYNWPGNIRELENVMERAFNMVDGPIIQIKHLPVYLQKAKENRPEAIDGQSLQALADQFEKTVILDVLAKTGGNRTQTAKLLGLSRAALYNKLEKHGVT